MSGWIPVPWRNAGLGPFQCCDFRRVCVLVKRKEERLVSVLFHFFWFFFSQYNVVKKWLEVEIAPDIRGRIPLLLTSLSFKVSVLEIPGEETRAP